MTQSTTQPNILFIVNDQERQRDWIPAGADLPARQRLLDRGLEFTNHYTHTSPCSPSRASIFTGQYVFQHGVTENSTGPGNTELPTTTETLGHMLRNAGYRTGYKGKWHLQARPDPEMDAFGFGHWEGNDVAWWGLPGTGTEFDDPIADQASAWLRHYGADDQPWFLTVAFVNPHDIMWYPLDQPWWQEQNPEYTRKARERLDSRDWGRASNLPDFGIELDEWFTELPENFHDDLHTKPDVHRRWMRQMIKLGTPGRMNREDTDLWLKGLDYYLKLHELNDRSMSRVLDTLDEIGGGDDTVIIFTSDHGDQCGSHGLRSKGPWNYQETMRIPLYMTVPGATTAGTTTDALSSHIDLARTIAELAGVDVGDQPGLVGESLQPLFADRSAT
ncbi:MAG: sulfatase-like hydrolase/transferase, partial [Acidimicrobiales bacterium]